MITSWKKKEQGGNSLIGYGFYVKSFSNIISSETEVIFSIVCKNTKKKKRALQIQKEGAEIFLSL